MSAPLCLKPLLKLIPLYIMQLLTRSFTFIHYNQQQNITYFLYVVYFFDKNFRLITWKPWQKIKRLFYLVVNATRQSRRFVSRPS